LSQVDPILEITQIRASLYWSVAVVFSEVGFGLP
jgi:hypothetical protein